MSNKKEKTTFTSMAFDIASVISSAYIITVPSVFLAALPIVCIKDLSERKKPRLTTASR